MEKQLFQIAVCDDVKMDKEEIAQMTKAICEEEQICQEISCFESAEALLERLEEGSQYDLLLIDVLMPGLDGMELARILRKQEEQVSIVFISCNREMAMQGYEVSAARYLAKPLNQEKLKEALLFCYGQYRREQDLLLPINGGTRRVAPKEIYYIEIAGRKCRIRMEKEEWDVNLSISQMADMLSEYDFIRSHQSFLVNFRHVQSFCTSSLKLTDGRDIPVSKHRVKEVRQAFFDYMRRGAV